MTPAPGAINRWVLAARPRTLPAAVVPVGVGAALVRPETINWLNTALAAAVALLLQIGTNYANDYSDGVRGTDEQRVGPFRLTASKLVPARWVKIAAFACFALAAVAGLGLAARTSWWLIALGASAILAGYLYTGGPKPYGYLGLGELFVLLYFGLLATVGTAYVQHRQVIGAAWWIGLATGAMACALLEANNLRDVLGDVAAGKRTLAARLGRERGAWLFVACVALVAIGLAAGGEPIVALVALVAYVPGVRMAFSPRRGRELLALLQSSSRVQLALGALLIVVYVATR